MNVARGRLALPPHPVRTGFVRGLTFAIASYRVYSLAAVNVDRKLTMAITMDFWDFESQTLAFFVHLASILGAGAAIGQYGLKAIRTQRG